MRSRAGRGIVVALLMMPAAGAGCGSSGKTTGGAPAGAADAAPTDAGLPEAGGVTRATGQLASWATSEPMPTPRANHCSVVANGFLVVIGGNYKPAGKTGFVNVADVHVARIAVDGSLGAWKVAGQTPSPVNSCTAASDGKDVYLVDGIFDDLTAGGKVRRATLSDAGDLDAWQTLGALPGGVDVLYSIARVTAGRLDAFYAELPGSGDGIALADVPVTGASLGTWSHTTWLTGFRGHPQYAFATLDGSLGGGSYVYALGGYTSGDAGNDVVADGAAAALDAAGVPGASFAVRPLPKPTSFGQAIAIDDWLFVIGGKSGVLSGEGSADAMAAKIGAGGALDAWTSTASLPAGRTSHSVAAAGDFVYVTGGGFDAGGLDTVFAARVRYPVP
jgi:hypothetical protein